MLPLSVLLLFVFCYCIGLAYTMGIFFTVFVLFCYGLTAESLTLLSVVFGIYFVVTRFFNKEESYV